MAHSHKPTLINRIQEFSIPLLLGVVTALAVANWDEEFYHQLVHDPFLGLVTQAHHAAHGSIEHASGWQEFFTLHFLINDLFMVLFFGVAAKEITEACLPNGSLNPPSKALNPLLATLGGVLGPVGVFFLLNSVWGQSDWARGWGIPTATDIALAWLIARFIFGKGHPAVSFLLLLAVADDAIGLGIIAFAYPDPHHPTNWICGLGILPAMLVAYFLRRGNVQAWWPYIVFGGGISWFSLFAAHLHPALALVFVVPFLPGPRRDLGLFLDRADTPGQQLSTLERFEHDLKSTVDFGLFFFAFANAGVSFAEVQPLTWIILLSLIVGKTVGISLFAMVGTLLGLRLPVGMTYRHVVVAGMVASVGLTVALFVSGQAYQEAAVQGAAKMGAMFSAFAGLAAYALGRVLGISPAPAPFGSVFASSLERGAQALESLAYQQAKHTG